MGNEGLRGHVAGSNCEKLRPDLSLRMAGILPATGRYISEPRSVTRFPSDLRS